MKKVLAVVLAVAVMAGLALPAAAAPNDIVGIEAVWTEEAVISLFTPVCYPSNTDVILKYENGETKTLTVWEGASSILLGFYYRVNWEVTGQTANEVTVSVVFSTRQVYPERSWTAEMAIPLVSLEQHVASHQPLTEIKENTFMPLTRAQQVFVFKPSKDGRYHLPKERECLPLLDASYKAAPVETFSDANHDAYPLFNILKKGQTYYLPTTTDYIGREYSRSAQTNIIITGPVRKLDFFGMLWSFLSFSMFREIWFVLPNGNKVDLYAYPLSTNGRDIPFWELVQTNIAALAARYLGIIFL